MSIPDPHTFYTERIPDQSIRILDEHPKVGTVLYPGLSSHPGHALQKSQAQGFGALITFDLGSYERPALFKALAAGGPVDEDEMRRTFNLGVGLIAIVDAGEAERAISTLNEAGEVAWRLGDIRERSDAAIVF